MGSDAPDPDAPTDPAEPADAPTELRWITDALLRLLAVDSTTGLEAALVPPLLELLDGIGAKSVLQPVAGGRSNVWAFFGAPRVLFTTHLDTVPPYVAPRVKQGVVLGRGACDAKGQIVAQLAAIRALLAGGVDDVAWLGVVGEETDSDGARAALGWRDRVRDCRAVIDGEPTGGALATGQRGLARWRLETTGVAAHSGMPELGRSAIWMLIDWLDAIRRAHAAAGVVDAELGPETFNLAFVSGGVAANVVPPHAAAILLARPVPESPLARILEETRPGGARATLEHAEPPALYPRIEGFPRAVVPFGSDAPALAALAEGGAVALTGPGSIRVAHTLDEQVALADLVAGAAQNVALARLFLARGAAVPAGSGA